eukprot:CAMPEP_0180398138 /NCGR_PEP_ID=MMETSP0989-20121125/36455_1 /TAXON_ID=697907 /ORGANISM="non described non described, Strain CCMP2293" /LENGTH=47 /DNA_ID= /DNA_START= /DNA_END= /DNA_ORIENTATION=
MTKDRLEDKSSDHWHAAPDGKQPPRKGHGTALQIWFTRTATCCAPRL